MLLEEWVWKHTGSPVLSLTNRIQLLPLTITNYRVASLTHLFTNSNNQSLNPWLTHSPTNTLWDKLRPIESEGFTDCVHDGLGCSTRGDGLSSGSLLRLLSQIPAYRLKPKSETKPKIILGVDWSSHRSPAGLSWNHRLEHIYRGNRHTCCCALLEWNYNKDYDSVPKPEASDVAYKSGGRTATHVSRW